MTPTTPARRRAAFAATAVAALVTTALLGACSAPTATPTAITFSDCRLKHVDTPARCGELTVPEDHRQPDNGRTVALHVAILPALARNAEPDPLYLLAGGPGQAASDLGMLASVLERVRRSRDIILVDQRGTGKSKTLECELHPSLGSSAGEPQPDLVQQLLTDADDMDRHWAHCIATLKGNPRTARTDDYIDDLEAVRRALGQPRINLWGGSYGSRVALRYMKRYPDALRSVVLDGVAPTAWRLPDDALNASEAELRRLLAACTASSGCAQNLPDALAQFDQLLARLQATPQPIHLRHPATGAPVHGQISDRGLLMLLWPLLYRPESERLIPQLIKQAQAGDYAPLFALIASGLPTDAISPVQRFAVLCAEDMLGRSPPRSPRFQATTDLFYAFCKDFPHGTVEPEFYQPTVSDIPTLLLSGALDPVTPPAQAELAAQTLSRSQHYVVGGMGHIVTPQRCIRTLINRFIEDGDLPREAPECTTQLDLPPPLFYTSPLEAQP